MEIVFIRHGTPDYSLADERQMTQLEKDYAPIKRECIPFLATQSKLAELQGAEILISSPYTRALQTAEIINRPHGLELFVEHDLREWMADATGGYIKLLERDRRWHEYRSTLKSGNPISSAQYETHKHLKNRVFRVLEKYEAYNKIILVVHFNVFESLVGFQKTGIGCGEIRSLNFDDIYL